MICDPLDVRMAADLINVRKIVKLFRGGLVFMAHRFVHHSTLGSRVIKKEQRSDERVGLWGAKSPKISYRNTSDLKTQFKKIYYT